MNIQITKNIINNIEINSVNAREIHSYLEIKTPFSMWIKRAIEKYDFEENQDFTTHKFVNGKATQIDYIVSFDMAKELCLVEPNEKGKETRKYFIDFEKNAKQVISSQSMQIKLMQETLNQLSIMDNRVTTLESTKRLENWQERALIDAKNKLVYSLAKNHNLENDKSSIKSLHSKVWKKFKIRFNIPRYNELPSFKFNEGIDFINKLTFGELI